MAKNIKRADCMSHLQYSQIATYMSNLSKGRKFVRTHENCDHVCSVSRPGKTRQDKKRGVWMPKRARNERQRAAAGLDW